MRYDNTFDNPLAKIIISGKKIEVFKYLSPITFIMPLTSEEQRERNLLRARRNLIRKVNANSYCWYRDDGTAYMPQFLTLTFKDRITDLDEAHPIFMRFIKRFNYNVMGSKKAKLKYTAVVEFQRELDYKGDLGGRVHYHLILYNVEYSRSLFWDTYNCWTLVHDGTVRIESLYNVRDIGFYLVKYMTKEAQDDRLKGRKTHFSSQGLRKSRKYIEDDAVIYLYSQITKNCVMDFSTKHPTISYESWYNYGNEQRWL